MKQNNIMKTVLINIGKILLLSFVLVSGLIISRIIIYKLGLVIPRMPQQADEATAIYYLFIGSLLLSSGFYFLTKNIAGSRIIKFLITFLFIFIGFGIGVSIESSIYSDIKSYNLVIIILFLPILLFSIVSSLILEPKQVSETFINNLLNFFKNHPKGKWIWKFIWAIISFPLIYFFFGIIVSPIVTTYYDELVKGLFLPKPETIIFIQLIRSTLFLIITLPIIINWTSTRTKLILSLGFAHFVMVFAYDFYLAIVMPVELVLIHGVEIFLDSFIYSWILIKILNPKYGHENNTMTN